MKKIIATALFATTAGALTFGAAASLQLNTDNLGAAATAVSSCDEDGIDLTWGFIPNEFELVGVVDLSGIDATCLGQGAFVTVSDGGSNVIATGQVIIAGSDQGVGLVPTPDYQATFGLTDSVRADDVHAVSLTITGEPAS